MVAKILALAFLIVVSSTLIFIQFGFLKMTVLFYYIRFTLNGNMPWPPVLLF
jgi:hypothetical protein